MKKITLFTASRPISSLADESFQAEMEDQLTRGEAAEALCEKFNILTDGELEVSFKWVPNVKVAKDKAYLELQAELEEKIKQAKIRRYYGRNKADILAQKKGERLAVEEKKLKAKVRALRNKVSSFSAPTQ